MAIPLVNSVEAVDGVEPNSVKYDLAISSNVYDGRLNISVGVVLRPIKCDIVNGQEQYTSYPGGEKKSKCISNLEQYAIDNPEIAELVATVWQGLSTIVAHINNKEGLL